MVKRSELVELKYTDKEDIPRVSLVPKGETRGERGIPNSLDLDALYGHMSIEWRKAFYEALHAQGLVKAADYTKADASQRFKAAMLTVIRHDFSNVLALAKQELK